MAYNPVGGIGLPEAEQKKQREKRDFWLGLILSLVLNGLYAALWVGGIVWQTFNTSIDSGALPSTFNRLLTIILNLIPWLGNIAALVFFALKNRPRIVLGILASYGIALGLALVAGVLAAATCFAYLISQG